MHIIINSSAEKKNIHEVVVMVYQLLFIYLFVGSFLYLLFFSVQCFLFEVFELPGIICHTLFDTGHATNHHILLLPNYYLYLPLHTWWLFIIYHYPKIGSATFTYLPLLFFFLFLFNSSYFLWSFTAVS